MAHSVANLGILIGLTLSGSWNEQQMLDCIEDKVVRTADCGMRRCAQAHDYQFS